MNQKLEISLLKKIKAIEKNFDKIYSRCEKISFLKIKKELLLSNEKKKIVKIWPEIKSNFKALRLLINKHKLPYFGFNKKKFVNIFIVRHYMILTYYFQTMRFNNLIKANEENINSLINSRFNGEILKYKKYITRSRFSYHLMHPEILNNLFKQDISKNLIELVNVSKFCITDFSYYKHSWVFRLKKFIYNLIFTLGKNVGSLLSSISLKSKSGYLISKEMIKMAESKLKPGDILLSRGNWHATNISIPGFWTHMSMYVGKGKELKGKYKPSKRYIVEAIGTGVGAHELSRIFNENDYLCALRPRVSLKKKKDAVAIALSNIGKKYDYGFDYLSDKSLVCTELVTKAYLPNGVGEEGVHISLDTIAISKNYPPNKFVKKFVKEYGTKNQELDLIFFIDGNEKTKKSFEGTVEDFMLSCKRSKFSILQK